MRWWPRFCATLYTPLTILSHKFQRITTCLYLWTRQTRLTVSSVNAVDSSVTARSLAESSSSSSSLAPLHSQQLLNDCYIMHKLKQTAANSLTKVLAPAARLLVQLQNPNANSCCPRVPRMSTKYWRWLLQYVSSYRVNTKLLYTELQLVTVSRTLASGGRHAIELKVCVLIRTDCYYHHQFSLSFLCFYVYYYYCVAFWYCLYVFMYIDIIAALWRNKRQ